jgi:hypothetical protein
LESDLERFNRIAPLCNTIPLIGKSDSLTPEGIAAYKTSILKGISPSSRPFLFGKSTEDMLSSLMKVDSSKDSESPSLATSVSEKPDEEVPSDKENRDAVVAEVFAPFAISSLAGSDTTEMDASLLMSSNYTPPLIVSELSTLVNHLFEPENVSWMKHAAARKFLNWRNAQFSSAIVDLPSSMGSGKSSPLRQARLAGSPTKANRRENLRDRLLLARYDPSNSLSSLSQQRIYLENINLDNIPKADRARWLLERMHEEVMDGNIGLTGNGKQPRRSRRTPHFGHDSTFSSSLPLDMAQSSRYESRSAISGGKQKSRRNIKQLPELPPWARQRHSRNELDPNDPLGLYNAWEGWGRAIVCGAGGGLVAGVVWVVLVRGWPFVWRGWAE